MPSIRQNMQYFYDDHVILHRSTVRHIAKMLALIVVIALALECVVFNVNFYLTRGYSPIDLSGRLSLTQTKDGQYLISEANHVLEFSNLNTPVQNIWLDLDSSQPAQQLKVKIQFTDDAHHTYFDSTEYTEGVPIAEVSTFVEKSKFINLNTSGVVGNLRIEFLDDDVVYPIVLDGISINEPRPFEFNVIRFLIVLGLLGLVCVFRPNSAIYKIGIREKVRTSKTVICVAVAIEIVLVTAFLFYGSNLVGVATPNYNQGAWTGEGIVNTFEVGGDNAQQYAELAKAMSHGQLYLDQEPPDWLKSMDDPYDKGARDELQKQTGEPYLFDVAYRDGHYYVYFGVVPVIMFYLPFYLATGANFPTAIGVLIAVIMFMLGITALVDRFARYHFKNVNLGLYLLLQIPLVMCSGVLYLVKFPTFYSLPIACALAFSVWGLYCWMRGRSSKRPELWYVLGSLCMALVAGCRPQLLVFSLVAFPLFWRKFITERYILTGAGLRQFLCLIGPYIVVAAGIMGYNYARFGSLTDFGANYNLTVNDMTKRGMNIGRLAPAFFAYFIQTPNTVGVFPFLQPVQFATTYMGQTIKEVTFGGIFACLPVLWILPFSRRILKMRIAERSTHTIAGVIVILLIGGLLVALLDAEMAGILQRYFADFSLMFLLAAVLLAFIVNENLSSRSLLHDQLTKVLLVAVSVSLLYSVLLCFVPETGWYSDIYPWAHQNIVEMVQFWK